MINVKVVTWAAATFGAVTFVACIAYGLVVPASLHMTAFLESVLPGFRWLTLAGFGIGLAESFLYGAYAGLAYGLIHNVFAGRWSRDAAC